MHQFNITLLDTYTALCAAPSSFAGPDGMPGELLRRLALERIVKNQLLSLVNEHSAMNSTQHGFTNNQSTITNLLILERHLAEAANSCESMDVISFDFSRAFDRVPHNILLAVLSNRGVSGRALEWIQSFLTDRTQRVQCEGLSTQAAVTSGVIQGSCLGPILWSIFMDSLLSEIDIPSVAFADDFKLLAM